MKEYMVDFSYTGFICVNAETEEDAKAQAEEILQQKKESLELMQYLDGPNIESVE